MKRLFFLTTLLLSFFISQSQAHEDPLWMRYPAISPDGEQVVFSYKGDIYKVSSEGGQAIPLTVHDAHDYMPVWSHDGEYIAFASYRYGNYDVFVIPADGGEAERVTYHSADDYPSDFTTDNNEVLFSSSRRDVHTNAQFPYGLLGELYKVSREGGMPDQVSSITAEDARYNSSGEMIIYHDRKGYEDPWRKHHTSSITRDLWTYRPESGEYEQITEWQGEDRNPVFNPKNEQQVFFLSERNGSFNVHRLNLNSPTRATAVTSFEDHPVRFLTISDGGQLCFSYDGRIFTKSPDGESKELAVTISNDNRKNAYETIGLNDKVTEMALSPNGKEIAFIQRGEVFVSNVDGSSVKKVTNTPGQERSVSFGPEGRKLVYAAERNNNWDVYTNEIRREEEPYFYSSTVLDEEKIVGSDKEEFQPTFSPDGNEVAFLEQRTMLRVINLESGDIRTVYSGENNYSYSDGDQHYDWSPDGNWFLINYNQDNQWIGEAALVNADGSGEVHNLTQSGYSDQEPMWMDNGKMMIWASNRDGQRNHGSMSGEMDVYGMFFTQEAYDRFQLSKEDIELLREKEQTQQKEEGSDEDQDKSEKNIEDIKIKLDDIWERKERLTIHSSDLSDATLSADTDELFYLASVEKGEDLWVTDYRTKETKILAKNVGDNASDLILDRENDKLYVLADGSIISVDAKSGERSQVNVRGEMTLYPAQEREYIFEHVWRQVKKKFYDPDLHGVDWEFYKKEYAKFLPHINNNHDFSEMLSEMLGELNGSHTGSRYRHQEPYGDQTASLGVFYDRSFQGPGLKVAEVIENGPSDKADSQISQGTIITGIDGNTLTDGENVYRQLNRKAGERVLLSLENPENGENWEEVIKPISGSKESDLLYNRWVEQNRQKVNELSGSTIGYVHIRGMNDSSYRTVFEEVLGKNAQKEAIVVDTRFNGGGWLHEQLATFLSGEPYIKFAPREKRLGTEPMQKWSKPSAVLVSEGNYSDAHMFPYAYRSKDLGKIIGMPVPGTGTAVWWEQQIDPTLVFGIPQVGMLTPEGEYLENNQLQPDIVLDNRPEQLLQGIDQQLRKAVEVLEKEAESESSPFETNN